MRALGYIKAILSKHVGSNMLKVAGVFVLLTMLPQLLVAAPNWIMFDAAFPEDYIDMSSIVSSTENTKRFWERGGTGRKVIGGRVMYPQYYLIEFNCKLKSARTLKWEYALEDHSPEALGARAKFVGSTDKLHIKYPTDWESIEPTAHSYALFDFVCPG